MVVFSDLAVGVIRLPHCFLFLKLTSQTHVAGPWVRVLLKHYTEHIACGPVGQVLTGKSLHGQTARFDGVFSGAAGCSLTGDDTLHRLTLGASIGAFDLRGISWQRVR